MGDPLTLRGVDRPRRRRATSIETQRDFFTRTASTSATGAGRRPRSRRRPGAQHAERVAALADDDAGRGDEFDGHFGPTTIGATLEQFYVWDMLVHRWDVARAVGIDAALTDAELDRDLGRRRQLRDALYMDGVCRPAVDVPAASDRDRAGARPPRPPGLTGPPRPAPCRPAGWGRGVRRRRPPPAHGARLRPRPAGAAGGARAAARARHPGAVGRVQPGLGVPGAGVAGGPRPLLGGDDRRGSARRLADPDAPRAAADRAAVEQVGLPRPLRRAGQGLDRPRRDPLAGPLLGRRRRHGRRC